MSVEPQKKGDSAEHPVTGGSTGVIEGSGSGSRKQRASKVELAAASPLQPGSLVAGRYRIERVLGVGGMGAVYEATQLNIGRKVALKVVRADYAGDPTMAKRFQREATAAASVHHPAVVMVHEFGQTDDGILFLVMELLDGESLSQRLKRTGKLQPREAIRIACEVLSALEAAHDAGVVHRDLKPDNITLLSSGGVKVLDFGIARILDRAGDTPAPVADRAALTDVGQMLGTPRYMSPEAVARMPVGPAADLYALGAILFEMLAGRHVFTEKEPVILMGHHLRSQPPRLREVAPELEAPYAVDDIVDHLLRKMPTERPASAETVRKKLMMLDWSTLMADDHNRDKLFTKPPDEEVPREKFFRGNGPLFHAMRVVVVLLIGATIAWILYAHRQRLDEERMLRAQQVVAVPVAPVETLHAPAVHQAHMRIEVLPATAEASITWDGEAMTGTEFDVTQDGAPHQLAITAPGFETETVELNADGPHVITIELDRATRPTKRRATPPAPH